MWRAYVVLLSAVAALASGGEGEGYNAPVVDPSGLTFPTALSGPLRMLSFEGAQDDSTATASSLLRHRVGGELRFREARAAAGSGSAATLAKGPGSDSVSGWSSAAPVSEPSVPGEVDGGAGEVGAGGGLVWSKIAARPGGAKPKPSSPTATATTTTGR